MTKQNLELIVKPFQNYIPAELEFNYDEIKAHVSNVMQIYSNKVYTPDTMKEAKADRAKLNKFSQAMNRQRIDVGKQWKKPLDEFEAKIKEIDELVKEPIALIDKQVKEYEEQIINEKLAEAKAYFESQAKQAGVDGFLSWSLVEQKDFSNMSKKINQIKKDIDATIEKVTADWAVIEGMKSKFESDMKFKYINTLDLQEAIATNQRLIEQEEQRAAYEQQKKEQEAARKAKEAEQAKTDLFIKAEDISAGNIVADELVPTAAEPIMKEVEEVHTLTFRVHGTADQLMKLSQFMKQNDIEFEKV